MLTLEQCKKLISDKNLTDKEVEEVRDELYILANLAFEHWRETKKRNDTNGRTSEKV